MKHLLWFFILVGMLCCVSQPAKAQNPNPCSQVTNTATAGQVLSAVNGGSTPPCQWVTGGGGGGSVSLTGGTGISVSPNPITGTGVITNTAPGASPCGPTVGEIQLYATATTVTCDSRFIVNTTGNGSLQAGTSLYFKGYGAMISNTDDITLFVGSANDAQFREVDVNIFVPPGGSTEKAGIGAIIQAQADAGTKYFDTQVSFNVADGTNGTTSNPYSFGAEGHCTTAVNCATLTDYNLFLANAITGKTLLENTSGTPTQLDVPAVTQFATLGNYVAAGPIISNDTADSNPLSLSKNAIADAAPGAGYVSFKAVAGTTAGTCKIIMKAGTSATPITLIDNIGSGC